MIQKLLTLGRYTFVNQLINLATIYIVGVVYDNEEIGKFAFYESILFFTVLSLGLRLDQTIIVRSAQTTARTLEVLKNWQILLMLLYSTVLIALSFKNSKLDINYYMLAVISAPALFAYNVQNEFAIKRGDFKSLGKNKQNLAAYSFVLKSMIGVLRVFTNGLIIADIVARWLFTISKTTNIKFSFRKESFDFIWLFKQHYHFFKFILTGVLISGLTTYLPLWYINANYSKAELGEYGFALLLMAPFSVLTVLLRDVFRNEINETITKGQKLRGKILKLLSVSCAISLFLGILYLAMLNITREYFFPDKWLLAFEILPILSITAIVSVFTMSFSGVPVLVRKEKYEFLWQIFYVLLILISLSLCVYWNYSLYLTVVVFSAARILAYLVYLIMIYMMGNE